MAKLEIKNVVKEFKGGFRANDGISLSVEGGQIFGLLGPNGAGKTTLVNQIIGLVSPTSGEIYLGGVDIVTNPAYARQSCSFQPQSQVPIDGLTPLQAIELVGRIRGGKTREVRARAAELIEALDLGPWADKRGETLSGGVRRLTAFCMATVVPNQLVILDEPTNDVDPLRRRLLWNEVRKLSEGGASVLLVTHNVLEAERSVDRLAIIDQGRVVAIGTPASLKANDDGYLHLEMILEPAVTPPALPAFLASGLVRGRRLTARVETTDVSAALSWAQDLKKANIAEEVTIGPATLEDVYIQMVGRQNGEESSVENFSQEVNHGLSAPLAS